MARTPPEHVQTYQSAWNDSTDPKELSGIAVKTNDVLVLEIAIEAAGGDPDWSVSGGSLTWTKKQDYPNANNANVSGVQLWEAKATANATIAVTADRTSGSGNWGFHVSVWRGSEGIGKTGTANNGTSSGAPKATAETSKEHSALQALVADWNATTGTVTWRTAAGAATKVVTYQGGTDFSVYGAYHADAGSAATKEIGLSAPSAQRWGMVWVEVLGAEKKSEPTDLTGTLTGSGSLAVSIRVVNSVSATLGGSGALSVAVRPLTRLQATLGGTGSLAAELRALVPLAADLRGAGLLEVILSATGGAPALELPTRAIVVPVVASADIAAAALTASVEALAGTAAIDEAQALAVIEPAHAAAEIAPFTGAAEAMLNVLRATIQS